MARYQAVINTDGYKLMPCSKKNWEAGTVNDFMLAINGWKSTERSLQEVRWRIEMLFKHAHYHCGNSHWEKWFAQRKNKIKYHDRLCELDRLDDISVPGFAQGYVDIGALLEKLKERISPGWLKAAARAIYNSGGRIEAYPASA